MTTRKVERIGRGYYDGWQNKKYYFASTDDYRIDSMNEGSQYYGPKNRHFLYYDKELNKYGYAFVQFCDLSKGDAGCFKVSKDDEYGRYPLFKDKNTVIYSSQATTGNKSKIVIADITDRQNIKYTTIYEGSDNVALGSFSVNDKYVLIKRRYTDPQDAEEEIHDYCIYRFSDKKTVCFDEPFDLKFRKDEGYIYNNMLVFRSYQDLVVRDLECYCDLYPAKCPLSDYTPNTEKPKKPWGFDWKPGN